MSTPTSATAFTALIVALALGGCGGGTYIYRPYGTAAALSGLPAARIPVPRDRPQGQVVIASSGTTDINVENQSARAIFVRVVVTKSEGSSPFVVEPRRQAVIIQGQPIAAAYVNVYPGDRPASGAVAISAGEERTFDFYFPLPSSIDKEDSAPPFELRWTMETDKGTIAERAAFYRVRVETAYAPPPYPYGYGPPGFYDPYWDPFWPGFHYGVGFGFALRPHWYGYPRPFDGGVYLRGRRP